MDKDASGMEDFDQERWTRIKEDAQHWWAGDLGRPLIQARLKNRRTTRCTPTLPNHEFASFYPMTVPVEQIVDRWDYDLSTTMFLGDAFPHVCPNFGPGVIAAFLGANLVNGQGQLAHLDSLLEIESIKGIQWVPGAGAPDVQHWPDGLSENYGGWQENRYCLDICINNVLAFSGFLADDMPA